MHYGVLVLLEPSETPVDLVLEEVLAPYGGKEWDWWQIGGRWTGILDGYEPTKDPQNWEQCNLCHGTGTRHGMKEGDCNGCTEHTKYGCPIGTRVKWPAHYVSHGGDRLPLAQVTQATYEQHIYAVCVNGYWWASERYAPWREDTKFPEIDLPPLLWLQQEYPTALAVIVDCHK